MISVFARRPPSPPSTYITDILIYVYIHARDMLAHTNQTHAHARRCSVS